MMPTISADPSPSRVVMLLAVAGGILLAATAALWAYYGTTVFFEMVRTGWLACF